MKNYPEGLMTRERTDRMRIMAMNTMQDKEYQILNGILENYIMPLKWNGMDIEFGVQV